MKTVENANAEEAGVDDRAPMSPFAGRERESRAMSDHDQRLSRPVEASEPSVAAAPARAIKDLVDLDRLVMALPETLPKAKGGIFRQRLGQLANLSLALRLSIELGRPAVEIFDVCAQLDLVARQTAHLAAKSSLPQGTQLAFQLLKGLSAQLRATMASGLLA